MYSFFRGGVDRTVTCPVQKQDGRALSTLYCDIFLSFPISSDIIHTEKISSLVKGIESTCILSFFLLLLGNWIAIQTAIP